MYAGNGHAAGARREEWLLALAGQAVTPHAAGLNFAEITAGIGLCLRQISAMQKKRYLIYIGIMAIIGLIASGYLTYLHQQIFSGQLTDFSFCGISRTISCEAVSASPYSEWFGAPVAWYGVLAYMLWLSLAGIALLRPEKDAETALGLIFITAACGLMIDMYLAYMMAFRIHSLCLLCLLTYILNLIILVLTFRAIDKPVHLSIKKASAITIPCGSKTHYIFPALLVLIAGIGLGGGNELRKTVENELAHFDEADFMHFRLSAPRYIINIASDPFIGEKDAKLTIVEFSDFQCPHCKKAHLMLQTILPPYLDRVKLVFKNLPLGRACNPMMGGRELHSAACMLARLGEAAAEQNQFWPVHDLMFEHQSKLSEEPLSKENILDLGRQAGLDISRLEAAYDAPKSRQEVRQDIDEAMRLEIRGTPTYLFNGLLIRGIRSPKVLQRLIEIELKNATQ